MAQHTIYIRDEKVWDRARQFASMDDRSLSSVIERQLRLYVDLMERATPPPCPVCGGNCGYWNLPLSCGR